jgi:hypothetical protein
LCQGWLEEREWGEVKNNYRVDRRSVPILSTAQDLLQGKVPLTSADDIQVVDTPQVGKDSWSGKGLGHAGVGPV